MKVLITGTTQGIGRSIAILFLEKGHNVIGIDRLEKSINHPNYIHYVCGLLLLIMQLYPKV
jgi:NAD(P)-dependent dehydrogenase (short-subunit alcohol dehydrogenase family)